MNEEQFMKMKSLLSRLSMDFPFVKIVVSQEVYDWMEARCEGISAALGCIVPENSKMTFRGIEVVAERLVKSVATDRRSPIEGEPFVGVVDLDDFLTDVVPRKTNPFYPPDPLGE